MSYLLKMTVGDDRVYKTILQENREITIGSGPKDTIQVSEWIPKQLMVCVRNNLLLYSGKKVPDLIKTKIPEDSMEVVISRKLRVAVNWVAYTGMEEEQFDLPYRGIIKIGRTEDNDIQIADHMVSSHQAVLRCEDGVIRLEDGLDGKRSLNGTYLNGQRVEKSLLKSGDVIDIVNTRITLQNTSLQFENVKGILTIHDRREKDVAGRNLFEENADPTVSDTMPAPLYRRSPRLREGLPGKDITLSKPPAKGQGFAKRRGMFTSLISSGAMIGASVATGMVSPALIAARAAGLVAPIASLAMNSGDNKRGKKESKRREQERIERYGAYAEAQKANINLVAEQQRAIIQKENPAPANWIDTVKQLLPMLWERRPVDSDFLDVRIGMGYEPLCVEVKSPADMAGFQMEEDEAETYMKRIIEETRLVDDVPARVRLNSFKTVGVIGNREKVIGVLKNMLVSLTSAHYYEEVRIIGVFDEEEKAVWKPVRWLPHVWDEEKQSRFLAFGEEEFERIDDMFFEEIHRRLQVREGYDRQFPSPYYVFLLGSHRFARTSKLIAELLKNDPMAGATTIFAYRLQGLDSYRQRTYLPPECRFVIDTDDIHGPSAYEFSRADRKFMFTMDPLLEEDQFDQFCRFMSALKVESGAGKLELPTGITFLEGMGVSNVRELDVWEQWSEKNKKAVLSAPLAVLNTGKPLELDIGDFNQPPVSLVAGMSGSGKSEFLKTWILSLAVRYSPEELSMVIIDYKGGSMAHSVEKLPHIVGKITDIESGDIMRPLASLSYELFRREMIFKECGVLDYKEYMSVYKSGAVKEPLPMFLIICDEFAELKLQHRDFMTELIRVARLGRSCGVRLVLATQSPAGVVDQDLFDNSRFQICLKVQNAAASKSMITVPDAAYISQNGRAYVRAGSDEIFELVQSYWTGAPYMGNREKKASIGNQVRIVEISGERIKTVWEEKTRFKSESNELQAVIQYVNRIAEEHQIRRFACPWKPELPTQIHFSDLDIEGGFDGKDWRPSLEWLRVPIGIFDMPERQAQDIRYLNFETDGHYGIYGIPGSGKTTMLKSILMGIGLFYSPGDVNMLIVDLGSQTLKMFEKMPHVITVCAGSEDEKLRKMIELLENLIDERKRIFSEKGVGSLKNYREHVAEDMPAIILAIDNFLPLFEVCPEFEPLIYRIGNEGSSYGVYLVYTANTTNGIRFKLTQNIHSGIAFEMNSKTDYTDVVGKVHRPEVLGKTKGRGFIKDAEPVLFQAVVFGEGRGEMEWSEWAASQMDRMSQYWEGPKTASIAVLPDVLRAEDVKAYYTERNKIPVGLDCRDIQPVRLDLSENFAAILAGIPGCGKSSMLRNIAALLQKEEFDNRLMVIDSSKKSLAALQKTSYRYVVSDSPAEVDELITELIKELIERQKRQKEAGQEGDSWLQALPQYCLLVDDLREFINVVDEDDKVYGRCNALIKNAKGLGLILLAGANAQDITELYTISPIVGRMVRNQNGLAVSGSAMMHSYYQESSLSYDEKTPLLKKGFGILYSGGRAQKVKIMED